MPGDITFSSGTSWWGQNLTDFVANGTIAQARLDDMATRILASWVYLGQDEADYPLGAFIVVSCAFATRILTFSMNTISDVQRVQYARWQQHTCRRAESNEHCWIYDPSGSLSVCPRPCKEERMTVRSSGRHCYRRRRELRVGLVRMPEVFSNCCFVLA